MKTFQQGSVRCTCDHPFHDTRLIAITGGPGGGKTAVLEMALRAFCEHVGALPEAAGVLFSGGFPRIEGPAALQSTQRAIFHVQREQEAIAVATGSVAVALCDRGTVDGAAYWPEPLASYWEALGTGSAEELQRYAAVIHLRTPPADRGYNHNNTLRIETAEQAQRVDDRILEAWSGHPNRHVIANADAFLAKAARALEAIRAELPPCCQRHRLAHEP